jgi:hypothetical protein
MRMESNCSPLAVISQMIREQKQFIAEKVTKNNSPQGISSPVIKEEPFNTRRLLHKEFTTMGIVPKTF